MILGLIKGQDFRVAASRRGVTQIAGVTKLLLDGELVLAVGFGC
jgi:hypothetical protein